MPNNPEQSRGYVLVVTMWVILGISAAALYFANSVILEQHAAAATRSGCQADLAIDGAIRYLTAVLESNDAGTLPETDEDILCEDVPIGNARFWVLGRVVDGEDDEAPVFGLVDENRKLNLNTATRDMLLELPGMTSELAAAIIDWRDEDEQPEEGGAENETYCRLDRPYSVKNGPFMSVEELRMVYGVTLGLLTGRDLNLNGIVDSDEEEPRFDLLGLGDLPTEDFGWLEYCTVWSREPNQQADGTARINVNSRNSSELRQLLQSKLGADAAARIAGSEGGSVTYSSVVEFYLNSGLTTEEFANIADALTVSDDAELSGLINVNTASETVLACIPGIDETDAKQLVAYRTANPDLLGSVAWITQVLDREKAVQAGPYITTSCYQFAADITAVGEGDRGLRRLFVVFDTVGDEVRVLYRRERSLPGKPFDIEKEELL